MLGSRLPIVAITVVLAILFWASAWWSNELDSQHVPLDVLLILANALPLLALRWNPVVVTLVLGMTYPLWVGGYFSDFERDGHLLQSLPTMLALYAAGSWDRPTWYRAMALLTPLWMMGAVVFGLWPTDTLELVYVYVVLVVVWALGVTIAGRRSYAAELEAKTAELEAARHELADRAVADERSRIARELHDVVAHAMSVITVQAGVGAHVAGDQPHRARDALAAIERTGREAMSELRRMLTMLRGERSPGGDVSAVPEPQPGLDDLPGLVATASDAGTVVTVATEGKPRPLPAGLDLAAYRVVQEALTNVAKHAPGVRAHVTVRFDDDQVTVEILDRGGPVTKPIVPGQGLRGMAERVALYDGALETGTDPDGFRVTARFPHQPEGREGP